MEIGIPSGFTPSRVHLEEAKTFGDELFRDYEMRDRKVVCYFDEVCQRFPSFTMNIVIILDQEVQNITSSDSYICM